LIKRALISTYDKSGLEKLAGFLHGRGIKLISSGGTYDFLRQIGIASTKVSDITAFPEILAGRVKTLHPAIHAGILCRADQEAELMANGFETIDLVIVNLYPFEEVVSAGANLDEALENIDIGGPAMLRAAAKNFPRVTPICSPDNYDDLMDEMKSNDGDTSLEFRRQMARKAFARTSAYDNAIVQYLTGGDWLFPEQISLTLQKQANLRYGENPHQQAALYGEPAFAASTLVGAKILSGKELSFNNIWDLESALLMALDFAEPFAAVIKHTNPCGAAVGKTLAEAYAKALAADPLSAFGSVISLNRTVDIDTARLIHDTEFIECVLAPEFSPEALDLMKKKKTRRLVAVGQLKPPPDGYFEMRSLLGGALVQTRDNREIKAQDLRLVTVAQPTSSEIEDLLFGFKLVKHVKSNAVLICRDGAAVGIGPGQTSRVDASIIAVRKAGDRAKGAVAASDAFFPMPDGLEVLANAGVRAVIQPGGSKGDPEVIAAADRLGVAMVFTGIRHFRH